VIARKTDKRIKLYSRPGNDLTRRFPLIVEALERLRASTCILDGEAVACGEDGIALFELIRHWRNGDTAFLYAFDLIELNGNDLRPQPLERRRATLARLLSRSPSGIQLNEHLEHDDGALVFEHACKSLPMSVGAGRLHSGLEIAPDLASKGEGRFKAEAGTLQYPP
jgi:ATP-dependent DNA ligase